MSGFAGGLLTGLVALAVAWLVLLGVLWLHRPSRDRALALIKATPDIARLAVRIAKDPGTPRRYRIGLVVLGVYLASPIDLVPDFLPGIGSLDDVVLAAIVLRWVGRGIGRDRIEALWPGDEEGLSVLRGLLGSD
jgi:uncharacterized membrane protein YkvA (DUF1232 family)